MLDNIREIEEKDTRRLEVHHIASIHREMNDGEYQALKLSIQEEGQLVPVILFKGKIVDGRHRLKALKELKIHKINTTKLPNNLTIEAVKNKVLGTEMRRADTSTQKAIRATRWIKDNLGATQEEASIKFGVQRAEVSRAKKLEDSLGIETINKLYNQGYIYIGDIKYTTSRKILSAIKQSHIEPTISAVPNNVKEIVDQLNDMSVNGLTQDIHYVMGVCKNILKKELE